MNQIAAVATSEQLPRQPPTGLAMHRPEIESMAKLFNISQKKEDLMYGINIINASKTWMKELEVNQ